MADTLITTLEPLLAEHPFLKDLDPDYQHLITECASNVRFEAGQHLFHMGHEAQNFYLIRYGKVALEIPRPTGEPIIIQTVDGGDVVGWSWAVPPYRWYFDARALEQTRAIAFDAECIRRKCESDYRLGYEMTKRFAELAALRLQVTLMQLLDVYGRTADK